MGSGEGSSERFKELGITEEYDELVTKIRSLIGQHFKGHVGAILLATTDGDDNKVSLDLAIFGVGEISQQQTYEAFGGAIEPLRNGLMEVFLDGEIRRIATQEGRERRRDEEDLASDSSDGHPN